MIFNYTPEKVFIKPGVTDMRKSALSLSVMIENTMNKNPFDQAFFVFCNKRCDTLKIVYYDKNGFCMWYKKLEEERFKWPKDSIQAKELTTEQLTWILSGFDINKAHKEKKYSIIS
jgi:transposase